MERAGHGLVTRIKSREVSTSFGDKLAPGERPSRAGGRRLEITRARPPAGHAGSLPAGQDGSVGGRSHSERETRTI